MESRRVDWCAEDLPVLRMAPGKALEPEPIVTIRPVELPRLEPKPPPPMSRRLKRFALVFACALAAPVLAWILVDRLVVTTVQLPAAHGSPSAPRQRHSLQRYFLSAPQRGDRVVTSDHSVLAVKRVLARPSDWLRFKNGVVYVNGRKLEEHFSPDGQDKLIQLGKRQYYVVSETRDGNPGHGTPNHGLIHRNDILGQLTD